MFKPLSMQDERHYQRTSTSDQQNTYLDVDVVKKVQEDDGYRKKVELFEKSLLNTITTNGWILDVGAGTCGEDEYLSTKCFRIICTDVNEVGLAVSRERAEKYGRPFLKYLACDGQNLPLKDGSISAVLFSESLHHLPDASAALSEVARVLEPGGQVCLLEPYSYDPWRRISEIRDYFRGTIEKSFSITQLRKMLLAEGLEPVHIERPIYLSRFKLDRLSRFRRFARKIYYGMREAFPSALGMIWMLAVKGGAPEVDPARGLPSCPTGAMPLGDANASRTPARAAMPQPSTSVRTTPASNLESLLSYSA